MKTTRQDLEDTNTFSARKGELFFDELKLIDIVEEHGTPLKINAEGQLQKNHSFLCSVAKRAASNTSYPENKYMCGYAIKANQHQRFVSEALIHTDFIEASSRYDLQLLTEGAAIGKEDLIVCHGFKTEATEYFKLLLKLHADGYNILPVVDSLEELDSFIKTKQHLRIGLRITSFTDREGQQVAERFGISIENIPEALERIQQCEHIELDMLHMHVANTFNDVNQRVNDLQNLFKTYTIARTKGLCVRYINVGGGLPSRSQVNEDFYLHYFTALFRQIIKEGDINNNVPILMNECGRFLVEESQFHILSVLLEKDNNADFTWYIMNGSSLNILPELHLDPQKKFPLIPLDGLDTTVTKPVKCVGITCDPEDFFNSEDILLPTLQSFSGYVAIPYTGAYQESLIGAARNFPGHCLIRQPKELIITRSGECTVVQNDDFDIFASLGYL